MSRLQRQVDRRTLLKMIGAVGVTVAPAGGAVSGWAVHASGGAGLAGLAQEAMPAGIDPFEVRVGDADLEDLRRRLQSPRWPPDSPGEPWSYGTDRAYLEELIAYWRTSTTGALTRRPSTRSTTTRPPSTDSSSIASISADAVPPPSPW